MQAMAAQAERSTRGRKTIFAHVRLFSFLSLLLPLFAALQSLADAGVPRVEVRVVPRDVRVEVPVEVVVERIIERLIFVPVPSVALRPWTQARWDVSRLPQAGPSSTAMALAAPAVPARAGLSGATVVASGGNANVGATFGVTESAVLSTRVGLSPAGPSSLLARAVAGLRTPPGAGNVITPGSSASGLSLAPTSMRVPAPVLMVGPREPSALTGAGQLGSQPGAQQVAAPNSLLLPVATSVPVATPAPLATADAMVGEANPGASLFGTTAPEATRQIVFGDGPPPVAGPAVAVVVPTPLVVAQRSVSRERRSSSDDDEGRSRSVSAPALSAPPTDLSDEQPTPTVAPTSPPAATPLPATPIPATPVPATPIPATLVPPTAVPATPVPATPIPATPVPPTAVPATRVPPTAPPATATRPPATPRPATATPGATKTPTPKAQPTKTPTPKPAATKTPTPKPAATKTPTPKPAPTKAPTKAPSAKTNGR